MSKKKKQKKRRNPPKLQQDTDAAEKGKLKQQGKEQEPPKLQQDTDADERNKLKKKKKKKNRPKLQQDIDAYEMKQLIKQLKSPKYEELYNTIKSQRKDKISSGNNETDNPVTPGCNQGEKEDINLPHSSCSGSSTARASGQKADQQSDIIKETNINLPNSSSKKSSSLHNTGHQVYQKNETSKKTKKTKNDHIPPKEKSQIKPNLPVLKRTKTENTKLSSNIDEARQSCSQSVPIKYSDNKKCQKDAQAITQVKAENKATAKVETLEPDRSMKLVSNTLKSVPQKEHIQTTEDLNKEKEKPQQKLKTCEAEKKLLNEQKQKLLSQVKGTKKGIMGRIEVLSTDKSVKKSDKESSLSCEYEKGSGKIFIKDQNIKISIEVTEGIQVVCKPRTRPVTNLVEDVKSSSGTLEGYSTEMPAEQKLLTPVKGTKKGIMGRIEVLAIDKSVKKSDKESSLSYEYGKASGKIFIKDQNIKINIEVTEDIQVVCKPRTRPVTDLVEYVKSSSGTLEGHTTERPEDINTDLFDVKSSSGTLEGYATARPEEFKTDSENYCKPTSDTKCDPNVIMKFLNENCQTVKDQATDVTPTNTLIGSEHHSQTGNDPNQGSSSFREFPEEINSSRITSVQENIQKFSNEYEKDIQAACEEFSRKMENYIKRNSLRSSDI